jgi:transposase-like protein
MAGGKNRDRRREAYWRRIVREQRGSGLTIREFCRKSKLTESAFHFWRRELERREAEHEQRQGQRRAPKSPRPPRAPVFVPVRVTEQFQPQTGGRIEIELSGGRRVHVIAPVDRQTLADVLAVLEGQPC